MILSSPHDRIGAGLLLLLGLLLTAGCAANNTRQEAAQGRSTNQDYLKAWKDATKRQAEEAMAEDGKPQPEPKMLPMTHFSAGSLYEKQNRLSQAVEQYRKAVELNPTFAAAHSRLGLCYTKMGDFRLAIETLRKAAELQPSAFNWNNLGFAYLADGNAAQAESCLGKALAIQPTCQRARMNMALALVRQGRDSDALSHLQTVSPDYIALYNLGRMQMAYDQPARAKGSLERALALKAEFPAARKMLDHATVSLAPSPATQPAASAVASTAVPGRTAAVPATQSAAASEASAVATAAPASRPAVALAEAILPASSASDVAPSRQAMVSATSQPVAGTDEEPALAAAGPADQPAVALAEEVPFDYVADGFEPNSHMPAETATEALVVDDAVARLASDYATRQRPERVISVADLDLLSLQWAAWSDAVASLGVDVRGLSDQQLVPVMRKWLGTLSQLEEQVRIPVLAYALAK